MGAISTSTLHTVSPADKGHHTPLHFLRIAHFPAVPPHSTVTASSKAALQEGTRAATGHHGAGAAPHVWDAASNFIGALLNCYRYNDDPRSVFFPPLVLWSTEPRRHSAED